MGLLRKVMDAARLAGIRRIDRIISLLLFHGLALPYSIKSKWTAGLQSEIRFWDSYFRTKGLHWPDDYRNRLDPDLRLQQRPADLLPTEREVHILDVGAGPLTYLGKKCEGKDLKITAVDPLADEYDKILDRWAIQPLVRTEKLAAEDIAGKFPSNTFDLVFARNAIDHSCDPEAAIVQMLEVVREGRYVLLEHRLNEADHERCRGLHQFNLSISSGGDFLITSRLGQINMTKKYTEICDMACELVGDDWLVVRIQKK